MTSSGADLILANRAYLDHDTPWEPGTSPQSGSGGLVAAVRSVVSPWVDGRGTTWVGAGRGEYDRQWTDESGLEFVPTPRGLLRHQRLFFSEETWDAHYRMVANSFFWPLLHLAHRPLPSLTSYYPWPVTPSPGAWKQYRAVNECFAQTAANESAETIWVHDYQLALVPSLLRAYRVPGRIGFFLHTPFPNLAVANSFLDYPGRLYFAEFLNGLLGADLVGTQTAGDAERFINAAVELCGAQRVDGGLLRGTRVVSVGSYPVGTDANEIVSLADAPLPDRFAAQAERQLPLVVGLERSDYTKGIPERLHAIARAYEQGERFVYIGIAAPTREGVAAYDALHGAIDAAAGTVSTAAGDDAVHFHQVSEALPWPDVVSLLHRADVIFTSSLADGMNLVPLQGILAQAQRAPGERAVIITGEDAGVAHVYAAHAQDGLVAIDPLDPDATTRALVDAIHGFPARVSDRLIALVQEHDSRAWAEHFLGDLGTAPC